MLTTAVLHPSIPVDLLTKVNALRQPHLLQHWERLSDTERKSLAAQIEQIKIADVEKLRESMRSVAPLPKLPYESCSPLGKAGSHPDDIAMGKHLLAEGAMGCLLIAGGQGTRLGFQGPKGKYPVTSVMRKSLFQLFAEKTLAAGKQAGRRLPLAIMTSPVNHQETFDFFLTNHFFGLDPDQLSFFSQGNLPFLNNDGNIVLSSPAAIAMGPTGNGVSLRHFVESSLWDQWRKQGVRYLNYILIDNALADPFDAELVGYHARCGGEVTLKCTSRRDAQEAVGVVVQKEGKVFVVEYSEMPEEERVAKNSSGSLKHECANLSLYCFNMDFVKKMAEHSDLLPWHQATKAVSPDGPKAIKFEKFIFDVIPQANGVQVLVCPREKCFAPLKNEMGSDSPSTVRLMLQNFDRQVLEEIWGGNAPYFSFELDPQFYYPCKEQIESFRRRNTPLGSYIQL